jgi:hypothetical protein
LRRQSRPVLPRRCLQEARLARDADDQAQQADRAEDDLKHLPLRLARPTSPPFRNSASWAKGCLTRCQRPTVAAILRPRPIWRFRFGKQKARFSGPCSSGRYWPRTSDPQLVDFAHRPLHTHRHRWNCMNARGNRGCLIWGRCRFVSER